MIVLLSLQSAELVAVVGSRSLGLLQFVILLCQECRVFSSLALMSLYNGPPRPGARGGRDQFNWESVKTDKDREFYLGHSVKATVGRWQKGKDVFWYTRNKDENDVLNEEIKAVKVKEQELMLEALGLKPKSMDLGAKPKLESHELAQLLKKGGEEEEDKDPDRVKGLGFAPGAGAGGGEAVHQTLEGIGLDMPDTPSKPRPDLAPDAKPGTIKLTSAQLKELTKADRDAAVKSKKDRKREKKEKKKKKKEKEKEKKKQKEITAATDKMEVDTMGYFNGKTSKQQPDLPPPPPYLKQRHDLPPAYGQRHVSPSVAEHRHNSPPHDRQRQSSPIDGRHGYDVRVAKRSHRESPQFYRQRHDSPPSDRQHHDSPAPRKQRHDSPPKRQRHDSPPAPRRQHHDSHAPDRLYHDSPPPHKQRHDSPPAAYRRRHDSPSPARRQCESPPSGKRHHDSPARRRRRHDSPPANAHYPVAALKQEYRKDLSYRGGGDHEHEHRMHRSHESPSRDGGRVPGTSARYRSDTYDDGTERQHSTYERKYGRDELRLEHTKMDQPRGYVDRNGRGRSPSR